MKVLKYYTTMIVLSVVSSHPISMICVPACNPNITAGKEFVDEWLSHDKNSAGIHQLRNHRRRDTVVYRLLRDVDTETKDCEEEYKAMVSIPETNNVSLDVFRSFFKAYVSHKRFVDYMLGLNVTTLVHKDWIIQSMANDTYQKLTELRDVLNFNVNNLFLLLNNTCDACLSSNCSESTTIKTDLINAMKNCNDPIYNVVYTIAKHSKELLKTIRNLRHAITQSGNADFILAEPANINFDSCLCNDSIGTESM